MTRRSHAALVTPVATVLIVLAGACDDERSMNQGGAQAAAGADSSDAVVAVKGSESPSPASAGAAASAMRSVGKPTDKMPGNAAGTPAQTSGGTSATTPGTKAPTPSDSSSAGTSGMPAAGTSGMPAAGGGAGSTSHEPSSGMDGDDSSCLAGITKFDADGPFEVEMATAGPVGMYVPKVPAGCKVPMVHYSNGTGANCSSYQGMLRRLATNGFIALCYENPNTGAGTYGLDAFKAALEKYPDLADYKFGSTGHSQGGMAALTTLARVEKEYGDKGIYTGLAMEPASGYGANPTEGWETLYKAIKSPVAMFAGIPTDTLVSQEWVQQAYDAMDPANETYFYGRSNANHISTIARDGNEIILSWFRWKLLGDAAACEYFKAMPMNVQGWSKVASRNETPCK